MSQYYALTILMELVPIFVERESLRYDIAHKESLIKELTTYLKDQCPHIYFTIHEYDDGHSRWYDYFLCNECGFELRTESIEKTAESKNTTYQTKVKPVISSTYQLHLDQRSKMRQDIEHNRLRLTELALTEKQIRSKSINNCDHQLILMPSGKSKCVCCTYEKV